MLSPIANSRSSARHPARNYFFSSPLIEAVKSLNRNDQPVLATLYGAQTRQLSVGTFGVSMKADQHRRRIGANRRHDEISTVCLRDNGLLDNGCLLIFGE